MLILVRFRVLVLILMSELIFRFFWIEFENVVDKLLVLIVKIEVDWFMIVLFLVSEVMVLELLS